MKKGDLCAVEEVLGWDPRGTDEEYELLEHAQKAFGSIKRELSAQRKSAKEWEQKYNELMRMQETYIKRLHALEKGEEKK